MSPDAKPSAGNEPQGSRLGLGEPAGRVLRALTPTAAAACFSLLLARTLPITVDEAQNWLRFSVHGVHYVTHNYLVANNHVLFTSLQALLPHSVVRDDPLNLRLLNIAVAIVLVNLTVRWLTAEGVPLLAAVAGVLLGGPITVLYFGVARGYLLGTLLAFAGIGLLAQRRSRAAAAAAAGIAFGLAIYTVPTFVLGMPGVAALLIWSRRTRDALVWGATAAVLAVALYLPILSQVVDAAGGHPVAGGVAERPYGGARVPGAYTFDVLRDSLYLTAFGPELIWAAPAAAVMAGAAWLLVRRRDSARSWTRAALKRARGEPTVFGLLAAYAISDLVVIELANGARLTSAPFARNSLFVGFVVNMWLLRQFGRESARRRWRRVGVVVVVANVLIAILGVALLVLGEDYSTARYGTVLMAAPPPSLRDVADIGATGVMCSKKDASVCVVYRAYLARHRVHVRLTNWTTHRYRCASGDEPPYTLHGVLARRRTQPLGLLCEP